MPVSVAKVGPYYSSGSISFSSLRTNFKEVASGSIKASELRRNTTVTEPDPIVPDSTENEQISTGSNLRLSQFRNSIKRYIATQYGTDDNSAYPGEPGFRMGRLDTFGRGIDWSGGGYNGRDGGSANGTVGNLTKNVQKYILITGTCGSITPDLPAAQINPLVVIHNVRMEVSGSILGYGGKGGGTSGAPEISGQNGGTALVFSTSISGYTGYNNILTVQNGARIYGGGGGGEKGTTGANGSGGSCQDKYDAGWHCQGNNPGSEKCTSGGYKCEGGWRYCCVTQGGGCAVAWWYVGCCIDYTVSGSPGGIGGNGGNGRGYNNQSGSLSGSSGGSGSSAAKCNNGNTADGATDGIPGEDGGDGGDWAQSGENTNNSGNGGESGRAVTGNTYTVTGVINSDTIKGSYSYF